MDDFVVCGNCKYNTKYILEFRRYIYICMNEDSDYYECPTSYNDRCACGEEKGEQ